MVRKHHDARKAREQHDSRIDFMLGAAVFRFIIESVELQHRAAHSIHQIARRRLHNIIRRESIGQDALGGAETVFGNSMVDQIGNAVAAIRQAAAIGNFIALGNNVAMHVRDIRNTNHNARTVGIAQASLDIVSGVITRID